MPLSSPGEGGKRRIVLALDRRISRCGKRLNSPRWRDYDMTLIVLDVDAEGKGEGQLAMGVQMSVNQEEKKLVIEGISAPSPFDSRE